MLVTEEKARKMVCPLLKDRCQASNCMWWAWYYTSAKTNTSVHGMPSVPEKTNQGFCGIEPLCE